jgi:FkbM family methyltransferase
MRVSAILPPQMRLFILNKVYRLRKTVFGKNAEAVLVNSRNGLFLVGIEDHNVANRLSFGGEYGQDEIERLKSYLDETDDLLIVGGHVGTIAIAIAKCCRSVTAIEANPQTFRLLQLNVLINGCTNVQTLNIAANDKEEDLQFVMSRVNTGGSKRMPLVRDYLYFSDSPEIATVKATRLDDVLDGVRFGVVFMDIEGSEYFALQGMQTILTYARTLIVEFVPHHLKNVSGVTVSDFVRVLEPHFSTLAVPSKSIITSKANFHDVLQTMYDRDESDDGIVFTK